jgi:hypothetical protein
MANDKLTLAQADATSLLGNLRGEVGEVITAWLLMRHFIAHYQRLRTGDPAKDFGNREAEFHQLMSDKLADELVGRLSELAEQAIGQLTFYFAARKMNALLDEVAAFEKYITNTKIRSKRNQDVSHKMFPGAKGAPKLLPPITYKVLLRAIAMALRLMKRFDRKMLGPAAVFLWREGRKKRYVFLTPPRAGYMLVPYLNLSHEDRIRIVQMELAEGKEVWTELATTIDGQPAKVLACTRWGVIVLGDCLLALDSYPLIKLDSLSTGTNSPSRGAA